jgi:hypothetical protein
MEFTRTSSGADLETLTAQAEKALRSAQRTVGREIAKVARRAVLADVRRRRRGGLSFSGMGVRLGASTTIAATASGVSVTVTAKPAGPWSIVEYGSRSHQIRPKRARVLVFDGVYTMHATHPGTRGSPVWAGAEGALDDAVTPVILDTLDEALRAVA